MAKYVRIIGTRFDDIFNFTDTQLNLAVSGKSGNDMIVTGLGNDRLNGGKGDDIIFGGGGNDVIDGAKGNDVAVYQGRFQDYFVDFKTNGDLNGTVIDLVSGRDGADTLKNVEFLRFGDGLYDVANDTFYAANHAPVVTAPVTAEVTEDGPISVLNAIANASDPDNDALSVTNIPASLPAGVSYNPATHQFTLDPSNAAYQHLAAGAQTTVTVNYGVSDGVATTNASVAWTVVGTNDAPVVTGAVTGNATEDAAVSTLNALATASDVDDNTTPSVVNVPSTLPPGVTFDSLHQTFSLDPSNAAYQHLAVGEQTTVTVNYGVSDGIAATAAVMSWTVTGVNDAPTLGDPEPAGETLDDTSLTLMATLAFADVDLTDTHNITMTALTPGAVGDASAIINDDLTGFGQGQIGLTYHLTKDQYDAAGGNVPATLDYRVTLDDLHGGVATKDISIPLADILSSGGGDNGDNGGGGGGGGGGNTPPQITGGTFGGFITDNPDQPTQTVGGILTFTDLDIGDIHSVNLTNFPSGGVFGGVTVQQEPSAGNPNGQLIWSFSYDQNVVAHLGAGETQTDQYNFQLWDSAGHFTTGTVSVTLTGINEAPVMDTSTFMTTLSQEFGESTRSTELHYRDGQFSATDIDNSDVLTFKFGDISFSSNESMTTTTTFLIDLIFGLDFGSETVSDTVTLEQALAHYTTNLQQLAGDLHMDSNGHWTFDVPDYLLDPISDGGSLQLTTQGIVEDQHGGSDTANLAITLDGSNDAPVSPNPNQDLGSVLANSGTYTFAGNIAFTDADFFDFHAVSAELFSGHINDPGQVSISIASESLMGGTGIVHWEYTIDTAASYAGFPDAQVGFVYTLLDGHDYFKGEVTLALVDLNAGILV